MNNQRSEVQFIGAGPGDPELMTVKGKRLLEEGQVVVWAGSLINDEILSYVPGDATLHDSSELVLEEIINILDEGTRQENRTIRLHSGDPSIYGALGEEIKQLEHANIPYRIIPGISSFNAAAARLGVEYTVPEEAQSIILTRKEGRTPVPDSEDLKKLARHRTSLVLFLSSPRIHEIVEDLRPHYPDKTPVSVGYRITWPDETWVHGHLSDITEKVREEGITRTALILVGEFLEGTENRSNLYDPSFSHTFRQSE